MQRTKRLAETVADSIRQLILNNDIRTGEPVNELALSESLGVSRTPVRESLSLLEQEGLIKIIPGKGAFVTELTIKDYTEINALRIVLDPIAAVESMGRITDGEIERQTAIWQEVAENIARGNPIDYIEGVRLDNELHELLIDRCDNERLREFVWRLRRQTLRYISSIWRTDIYNEATAKEHLMILDCVRNKDAEGLKEIVAAHTAIYNQFITKGFL